MGIPKEFSFPLQRKWELIQKLKGEMGNAVQDEKKENLHEVL